MRRDAGFTAFTILIAGLGIGASSTVFSVVNALLLRPLPFAIQDAWFGSTRRPVDRYAARTLCGHAGLNRSFSDLAAGPPSIIRAIAN